MTRKTKNIWKRFIIGLTICLSPIFVNWIMTIPCNWSIEGPQEWIGFWGAYLGAIASFVMAYIAWTQMCVLSEQNRPFLYPTIEIVPYRIDGCNHFDYCLHIVNHGSRIASNVHIEIGGELLDIIENKYSGCLSDIRNLVYDIPEKDDIFLKICPELSIETIKDKDYSLWLEKFKQSSIQIKIDYNSRYVTEKTISLRNTVYAKTSSLQMLYHLKQSIDNLNETLQNKNRHKEVRQLHNDVNEI